MAKYYGNIGYVQTTETVPGVWTEVATERFYRGEVPKNTRRWSNGESINGNINISNTISIVADDFAITNFGYIRYANYMGFNWEVSSIDFAYPRLNLTLGNIYKGVTPNG